MHYTSTSALYQAKLKIASRLTWQELRTLAPMLPPAKLEPGDFSVFRDAMDNCRICGMTTVEPRYEGYRWEPSGAMALVYDGAGYLGNVDQRLVYRLEPSQVDSTLMEYLWTALSHASKRYLSHDHEPTGAISRDRAWFNCLRETRKLLAKKPLNHNARGLTQRILARRPT